MSVFRNDVGRPSNKTIMIRSILKGICLIIVIVAVFAGGYLLNIHQDEQTDKQVKNDENKVVNTTKKSQEKTEFDVNKVTTKNIGSDGFLENAIEVYVYENKLDSDKYPSDKIINITPIDDVAVIELRSELNILLLVNQKGEVLYDFERDNDYYYCSDNNYSSECHKYEVNGNTIKYIVSDLGQDISYTTCVLNYNKDVLREYEITYEDGKLSKPNKLSSMSGKEYIEKHNIDCSR